jgi:hypothetical protein
VVRRLPIPESASVSHRGFCEAKNTRSLYLGTVGGMAVT